MILNHIFFSSVYRKKSQTNIYADSIMPWEVFQKLLTDIFQILTEYLSSSVQIFLDINCKNTMTYFQYDENKLV